MSSRESRIKELLLLSGIVICGFFLLLVTALGQTETPPASSSNSGGNNQSTPASPTITSGSQLGDIFFRSRNSFIFSLNADESYQDNANYNSNSAKSADYTTRLSGRVAYQYDKGRTRSGLDFTFGRLLYYRNDRYDQYIADGGFDLSYQASPRWTINIGDRAGLSPQNGSFLRRDSVLIPLPPTDMPNNTVLLPINKTYFNTVSFSSSYMMSRRSSLDFSTYNTIFRYDQVDLKDQISYGASAGYSYRLSERNTLELNYAFGYFDSTGGTAPASNNGTTSANLVRSHLVYMGISRKFSPSLSGSLSGGALYLVTDSTDLATGERYRPGLKPVLFGNIIYSPTFDPRTFFSMQANQTVSNGAGLGTVAMVQSASLSIGRRFTKNITGSATSGFSRNEFLSDLDNSGRANTVNGFFAGARLTMNITERFNFYADYQHFQQLSTGIASYAIPGQMIGNTVTIGLGYSFPWFF
jgi:hypothetical protein